MFSVASVADIQGLVDRIVRLFQPEKIILFGSHSRGEAGPDSDVDLLVVMPHEGHAARKAAEITELVHPRRFSIDLIVRDPATLRKRAQMNDWFVREVMREGRVMYAA
ncbi:MAG TPA: nucleotidyltransferase domain-containing protein [Chthoniobacterales bacterium]|nr:nucleotidyltransferase domain-containing protein [Chthoniobacterales bacterium]